MNIKRLLPPLFIGILASLLLIPTVLAYSSSYEIDTAYDMELKNPVIYKYQYVNMDENPSAFKYIDNYAVLQPGQQGDIFYVRAVEDAAGKRGVAVTNYQGAISVRNLYWSTATKNLVDSCCIQVASKRLSLGETDLKEFVEQIDLTNDNLQRKATPKSRSKLLKQEHNGFDPDGFGSCTIVYIYDEEK